MARRWRPSRFTPWTGFSSLCRRRSSRFSPLQLQRSTTRMSRLTGFFRTFPRPEKCARVAGQSIAELGAHSSSSTLSAHHMARGGDAPQGSVPGQSSVALLGGLQGVLLGQSPTRGVTHSDAAARWQAQDLGSEFWPKRACRYFLQGSCQQGQAWC